MEKKAKDDTLWYRIGCMYLHGIGTEPDEEQAERYLKKAYDYGNTHAAYQLARLYIRQETQKLRVDPEATPDYEKIIKAVKWLEEAARQENPFADYALGRLYKEGVLLEKIWKSRCSICNERPMPGTALRSTSLEKSIWKTNIKIFLPPCSI